MYQKGKEDASLVAKSFQIKVWVRSVVIVQSGGDVVQAHSFIQSVVNVEDSATLFVKFDDAGDDGIVQRLIVHAPIIPSDPSL